MKVKVAVLDYDKEFVRRLSKVFQSRYQEGIQLSLFSEEEVLYGSLDDLKPDIVLFDEGIKIDPTRISKGIVCGCLSSNSDVSEIEGYPAICKYQSAEKLYKEIISVYAERTDKKIEIRSQQLNNNLILFTSVQGGCGTSVAAAAYALRCASNHEKVLYINLESFGDPDHYFYSDGKKSFSDVIYYIKSKKSNFSLLMENMVQIDKSGVSFFKTCKNAYDMLELQDEEVKFILDTIQKMGSYDKIVVDLSGDMNSRIEELMKNYASKIVYVTDGSETGRGKFLRFCEVIKIKEEREGCSILNKTVLIYNRYSSKSSSQFRESPVSVIDGIHRYEGLNERELIEKISRLDLMGKI